MSNEEARYHFPAPTKMEPLTLDQLRDMLENDGEIIGAEVIVSEDGVLSHAVIDSRVEDGICASTGASGEWLKEKDYGKTWLAYAYLPAHIDREALCGEWQGEDDGYADGELVYDVWRCGDCGHVEETDDPDLLPRFCPSCGRAMTPEAWAELEKRLMG